MGAREQKRAGSVQPTQAPDFMQPKSENAPSLRSGFKPNSEALYTPTGSTYTSPKEIALHQSVERFNIVNDFLNSLKSQEERDFARHLLLKMIPDVDIDELSNLDSLLAFVSKALDSIDDERSAKTSAAETYKVVEDFLARIE